MAKIFTDVNRIQQITDSLIECSIGSDLEKNNVSVTDYREILDEIGRRLQWHYGEEWLNNRPSEEIKRLFVAKCPSIIKEYFERKTRNRLIDIIASEIMKAQENGLLKFKKKTKVSDDDLLVKE